MEKKIIKANYTPLWPTPFGWANLGEDYRELNEKLVDDIETERELDSSNEGSTFRNNNKVYGDHLGWQSKTSMEDRYSSFAQLVPAISSMATEFSKRSGAPSNEGSNVRNLWANVILGQGGYLFPHTHGKGDMIWTGVYYPKGLEDIENLDELDIPNFFAHGLSGGGGKLIIRDNSVSKTWFKQSITNKNFSITPRESLLILFPAWLEHMITPTENHEKRYSISFGIYREPVEKSDGPETQTVAKMGWVTSDSHDDTIKDDVTVIKKE